MRVSRFVAASEVAGHQRLRLEDVDLRIDVRRPGVYKYPPAFKRAKRTEDFFDTLASLSPVRGALSYEEAVAVRAKSK